MAEYISREKAIDAVKQATGLGNTAFCDKWDAMNRLRLVPAADVTEAVRCKDCKNWTKGHVCLAWSRFGSIETKAEQFCSYGVRND